MEKKKKQYRSKWSIGNLEVPVLAKVLILCSLIASFFIMAIYVINVGTKVSSSSENWGDFGALLSGTFGMLASFSAVATLLIVIQQLKSQDEITKKQIESIEFDRYDRHRRIFFERLEGIEVNLNNEITITQKEELYQKIYPDNSPLSCNVKIELSENYDKIKSSQLIRVKKIYDEIRDTAINKGKIDEKVLLMMIELNSSMNIKDNRNSQIGDVYFLGEKTPINVYDIQDGYDKINAVGNSILAYSGNEKLTLEHLLLYTADITDSLLTYANKIKKGYGATGIKLHKGSNLFELYEDLYVFIVTNAKNPTNTGESKRSIEELIRQLRRIIMDKEVREEYYTPAKIKSIREQLCGDDIRNCFEEKELVSLTTFCQKLAMTESTTLL
ncbi:hypothetical protein [Halomonas sp. MCCC 1A11062]|uniref:hypothetical protein n=1 Tax=Halomonas sp. MCCC 1A11062 TaxID=2733485 RepID=UPI001F28CCE3|nr:hypothetical protein [Halomonas sp. MCCC 1A11062]MCE8039283.1 hypothetical protein [Halomonas sp. MCCC 1A11062]